MPDTAPALLALEDGSVFSCRSVGAPGERAFELVFNTAMTGYQEILTDPSYAGQGVLMTYPQIGNYGCVFEDDESDRCWAAAMLMREMSAIHSNWRADCSLGEYLTERGVMGADDLDTRELTLLLREKGSLKAVLSTECLDAKTLVERAKNHASLEGRDLASTVTCAKPYPWAEPLCAEHATNFEPHMGDRQKFVAYDFGAKRNILRCLVSAGFDVTVVPANTPASDVLAMQPAGVFLSNGPGDPSAVKGGIAEVAKLIDANMPIFGICLGHQILANALGAQTYKMKFGHHGANHPVVEIDGGRIDITSQNHGFAVDPDSMASAGLELTHRNGNDDTVEGMRHLTKPVFSVQYHPEAAPGPHDPGHLFHRFREMVAGVSC